MCDTLNNRVEVFDADGKFIATYGKNGDGPGYFARPKGIAIDSDGHIWVADGMQDRVQVFNQQWQLLIVFGGHGLLPGQFQGIVNVACRQQEQPGLHVGDLSRTGAAVPLRDRRRSRAQLQKDREAGRTKKAAADAPVEIKKPDAK